MSALKSNIKCELSKTDSLSEFEDTKIKTLNNQQNILETLKDQNDQLTLWEKQQKSQQGTDQPNKANNQH